MTDEELRKIDLEQLLAEKQVLEELLKENPRAPRRAFWLEELQRLNTALEGLFLPLVDRTNERKTP